VETSRSNFYLITIQSVFFLGVCSAVNASTIEKPAGALPVPRVDQSLSGTSAGLSKSKVVPLKRRMDLAAGATFKASQPKGKPKHTKVSVLASTDQAKASDSTAGEPPSNASDDPAQDPALTGEQAGWDSANKRYNDQDASSVVSKTVRVEDIIEPSVDYRYSSARRKNPFIPEIVLSGQMAKQRELSPNDVEIPIVSPLQAFPVSQLSVIGVWETDAHVWKALIGTPATQGIEATLGDPVGNSGGRIMSITPESVIVREFSVRFDGTREYRDMPLHMGSDLPAEKPADEKVGGRLILRPGATQPEIVAPAALKTNIDDYLISNSSMVVPSGTPGTLKTIEQVMDQKSDGSVQPKNTPMKNTVDQAKRNGDEQEVVVPPLQKTPVSGGEK
jgi:Tfp pilus assembly protein PilP